MKRSLFVSFLSFFSHLYPPLLYAANGEPQATRHAPHASTEANACHPG